MRSAGAMLVAMLALSGAAGCRPREVAEKKPQAAASSTPEAALRLGDKLPDFTLTDLDGKSYHLGDFMDGPHFVAVVWVAPTCPCSNSCTSVISRDMPAGKYPNLRMIGVVSDAMWNFDWFKEDLREKMQGGAIPFPVVIDRDGEIARRYGAERTPTVYLADKDGRLRFWGAPETSLEPDDPSYRFLFKDAVDALAAGRAPEETHFAPFGCLISEGRRDSK